MANMRGDGLEGKTRDKGASKRDHGQAQSQMTSGEMTELIAKPKQRGGKRPGAGRKEGSKNHATIEKELLREQLRRMVAASLEPMVAAQVANSQGIKYLVAREKHTGKFRKLTEAEATLAIGNESETEVIEVWEERPNVQAFTDLLNRTIDKPIEQVNVDAHVEGVYRWKGE